MIRVFKYYISYRKLLLVVSETLILTISVFVGTSWDRLLDGEIQIGSPLFWQILLSSFLVGLLCQVSMVFNELYDWRISTNRSERTSKMLVACGTSLIALAVIVFFLRVCGLEGLVGFKYPLGHWSLTDRAIVAILGGFTFLLLFRWFFHWAIVWWKFGERLLILGSGPQAQELAKVILERSDTGYELLGMMSPELGLRPKERAGGELLPSVYGDVMQLYDIARAFQIHRVVIALEDRRGNLPTEELLKIRMAGIKIEEREFLYEKVTGKIAVESLRPSYLIFSEGFRKSRWTLGGKRLLDVVASLLGLLLSLPVMILAAIAVKLDSRGPVFFRQNRVGQDGKAFTLYKFRSMRNDAERESGPVWARDGDTRITRIGRFMRKTRIDEIPQMINVLRGDMSFVGPRPERPFFVRELAQEIPYYRQRLNVKPGITGWAQICYPYGSSVEDARQKLQFDLYYIKNMSIVFDLSILMRTIKVVVLGKGT